MNTAKIITRIFGGIGNQLFIYAAARRMSLVNNIELVIDDVSGFSNDTLYQRQYQLGHFNIPCRRATAAERFEPFARVHRYVKRKWNQRRPFSKRAYIQQEGVDFEQRLLLFKPHGTVYLEGYWQSEGYFKDVEAIIRQDLQIEAPTDELNTGMSAHIRKVVAVAVHVRFFDIPDSPGYNNASEAYYFRAIAEMESRVPGAHYFLFSDQPEAARKCISLPEHRFTLVAHNKGDSLAYADLWLMSLCSHFIIANSTFSWWGAWLSANASKIVIAPSAETRQGGASWAFEGLLPDNWIKMP